MGTEKDGADAAEHEDEGDAPCDVGNGDFLLRSGELGGELAGGERDGEEILFEGRGHLVSTGCTGHISEDINLGAGLHIQAHPMSSLGYSESAKCTDSQEGAIGILLTQEANEEEHPLLRIEQPEQRNGVGDLVHGRLQRPQSGGQIPTNAHVLGVIVCHGGVVAVFVRRVGHFGCLYSPQARYGSQAKDWKGCWRES